MSRFIAILFFICITVTLEGCVPFPHIRQLKPEIYGVLLSESGPLKNVNVRSCSNGLSVDSCEKFMQTYTDGEGNFHFPGNSEFLFFKSLLGDPLYAYGIEATSSESKELSWWHADIGYSPQHVVLQCNLNGKLKCIQILEDR